MRNLNTYLLTHLASLKNRRNYLIGNKMINIDHPAVTGLTGNPIIARNPSNLTVVPTMDNSGQMQHDSIATLPEPQRKGILTRLSEMTFDKE